MIREFDKVRIIASGKTGVVVDVRNTSDTYYLVELDDDNEIIDCTKRDIEKYE
mgnify:CR=1 FL=1|jgi:hypothetical protein